MPSRTDSKKRSGTSASGGPPKKKAKVQAPTVKPKPAQGTKSAKKPARPVTRPTASSEEDSDLDEPGFGEEEEDWGDEEDKLDVGSEDDDEEEEVDASGDAIMRNPKTTEDKARDRQAQKALHAERKAAKPYSDLLTEAKRIWSLAAQKTQTAKSKKTPRSQYVSQLATLIKGHIPTLVLKHDASRIVQTVLKHGTKQEREQVWEELKGDSGASLREVGKGRYGKFLVLKLFTFLPSKRGEIIQALSRSSKGLVPLLLHHEATRLVADAYELHANQEHKQKMMHSIWSGVSREYQLANTTAKSLVEALGEMDLERRKRVMHDVGQWIDASFSSSTKSSHVAQHAITHRILWEYLQAVNKYAVEGQWRVLFDSIQELVAEMVHTRDGSRLVREFIKRGNAKDRKQLLSKTLKPHLAKMVRDEEAQMVLFEAVRRVDDTKLLLKLITPLLNLTELCETVQGRRFLMYLILPKREENDGEGEKDLRRWFTPQLLDEIRFTDTLPSDGEDSSKKDPAVRATEVRNGVSGPILEWVTKEGCELVPRESGSLIIADAMLWTVGEDKSAALSTLLGLLTSSPEVIDLPHVSRMYKTLLQGGHFHRETNSVKRVPKEQWNHVEFAQAFADKVEEDGMVRMCTKGERGGAFVVTEVINALPGEDKERITKVKTSFGKDVIKDIDSGFGKGKGVLLEALRVV